MGRVTYNSRMCSPQKITIRQVVTLLAEKLLTNMREKSTPIQGECFLTPPPPKKKSVRVLKTKLQALQTSY
jgi:hypothetical protein